jgi:nucleotide-binding universal stress UspA family protein
MVRISKILFPTDYSDLSRGAAPHAALLARAFDADVVVVHFIEPIIPGTPPAVGVLPVVDPISDADRENLRRFAQEHFPGLRVHAEVRHGFPARDIAPYAASLHADLIVIGTHADGILKRIIHGSVGKSVLESAPCPVLMVPLAAIKAQTPD